MHFFKTKKIILSLAVYLAIISVLIYGIGTLLYAPSVIFFFRIIVQTPQLPLWAALLLEGLQSLLILSFPLILGMAYAGGKLKPAAFALFILFYTLFALEWISPIITFLSYYFRSGGLLSSAVRNMRMNYLSLVEVSWRYSFYSAGIFIEILLSFVLGFALGLYAKRTAKPRARVHKIVLGAALALICVFIVLNHTGVLDTWREALPPAHIIHKEIDLIEAGLHPYTIRLAPAQNIFAYQSDLMLRLRIGHRPPFLLFSLLAVGIGCFYCGGKLDMKKASGLFGIVLGAVGITLLFTPVSAPLYDQWADSLRGLFGFLPPAALWEWLWYALMAAAVLGAAWVIGKLSASGKPD